MNRPNTVEEIPSLPEGPVFGLMEVEVTEEDRRRGSILVNGKIYKITGKVETLRFPIPPQIVPVLFGEQDVISYCDAKGIRWSLGQYADGRWFRQIASTLLPSSPPPQRGKCS